ncbi:MAG TPA: CusA/CzcA family heavy metal efflux RND transporter [Steroidobacteraceae bacterium]|nr:CusA/CzcA family heavy metal efflux RND transporter [Steroidobacteraceae bacterium]
MLRALLSLALLRRPIVLVALVGFFGAGLLAFTRLNIEAYPNPAPVILEITAQAPGLSAEEMERYYTVPMEVGLAATPGVNNIRSTSFYGLSFVRVTFDYGVDYYFAYTQAALSLQQNVTLPNGVQPQIQASSLVGEIYRYQLVGPPHFGLTNLRTLQDWVLQRRFLTVPGIVQVVAWGGTTKEYQVEADPRKLEGYHLTVPQLVQALGNANINVGGRTVDLGQQSVNIRGIGLIKDVSDIENVVLNQVNGVPVLVKDVAHVQVGYVPRLGQAGRDEDDDAVLAILVMNRTLHTKEVLARVTAEVDRINRSHVLPPGVRIVPYYDRSSLVAVTTHTVLHNLVFGCVLVFLIQWVFLGDLRSAVIVATNIPFALFFSVILLVATGESANLLSVGAVDFGIIVDSAVILVENVFRNFQQPGPERLQLIERYTRSDPGGHLGGSSGWTNRLRLIFISAMQVDRAVLFSTLITVAAFIPLFTMQGVEGQIFGPMARTYGYALAGALLATFSVTPALCSLLLPRHVKETETWIVRSLRALYTPVLRWALDHRRATVALGVGFLLSGGGATLILGTEFLPTLEEGNLWIRATLPPTISLQAGDAAVTRMRAILMSHPEVTTVTSQHGRPDDGSDASGFNNVELFCPLKPFDTWAPGMTKERLVAELQRQFTSEFVGTAFNFSQYIQDNVEEGLSGIKGANSVKIFGPDLRVLERLADEIYAQMRTVKGVEDLGIFRVLGQPNLNITVDRARAARYGLNSGDVNALIQAAMGGTQATTILEGDRQFALTVRFAPQYRDHLDSVRDLEVGYQNAAGGTAYIPLTNLASVSLDTGASYIYHERNERFIPVKFSVRGRDLGSTVAEAQERIARKVQVPQGYRLEWSGEFDELQQARARLMVVIPIAVAIILVLLYGLFNSLRDSLLTLAGIPFSMAGGLLALCASGQNLSVSAEIGFISLFGVSVMNGILVITYFRQLWQNGLSADQAMFNAAEQRMRPMLMTALSACIGLFPAAISTGIGSQVQRPLATVVVGGMLLGPVMLLVVAPALQIMFLGKSAAPRRSQDDAHDDTV